MIVALLALAGPALTLSPLRQEEGAAGSRIRIVPQSADTEIQYVEESLDGSRLITGDRTRAPRLWDAKRQILLTLLNGHGSMVTQVNFSPDGSRALSLSSDQLRIWDSTRAKLIASFPAPKGETLVRADLTQDGTKAAVATQAGKVFLVPVSNPEGFQTLGGFGKSIPCVEFSPDDSLLFTGGEDKVSRMFDVTGGKLIWEASKHTAPVRWAMFSRDGKAVVDSAMDSKAVLYNSGTGAVKQGYVHVIAERGGAGNVDSGATLAGPNGDQVVACKESGDLIMYKPGTQDVDFKFEGHKAPIREMRTSRDRRYLGTYGDDGNLYCWDTVGRKRIDLDLTIGSPYAADFSPTRPTFWLGYAEGKVSQYDLTTGKETQASYGATRPLSNIHVGGGPEGVLAFGEDSNAFFSGGSNVLFLDGSGNRRAPVYSSITDDFSISPTGQFAVAIRSDGERPCMVFDIWAASSTLMFKEKPREFKWSPDGQRVLMLFDEGLCYEYNAATGERLNGWEWKVDKELGELMGGDYHPNGKWVVTTSHAGSEAILWDVTTGKYVQSLGKFDLLHCATRFSSDGKLVTLIGYYQVKVVECETGKVISDFKLEGQIDPNSVSADGARVLVRRDGTYVVIDTRTGKEVRSVQATRDAAVGGALNEDGTRFLSMEGDTVTVWDVATGQRMMDLQHSGAVGDMRFTPDSQRIITVDDIGGGHVWSVEPVAGKAKCLATIVLMGNDDWLVYDDEGRFDATDPADIDGAYFVLEWQGGLEPISMPQFKGQFYEPNLLAKAMGLDKESLRDVPSIQNLHLYPDLKVKPTDKPFVYDVTVKERDSGGIGKVSLFLNGKQFLTKKGSSYVELDLNSYANFMLPETRLGGQGNLLSVTVSNEDGSLTSLPVTVDVGVPSALKAPEVKLHALFVGVGDYPGSAGDLLAPPSDAAALEAAIRTTAQKLLPGRVDTTVLTTKVSDASARPTREKILQWFKDTAKSASSSDIVLVFFAGHGVSKVGDQTGYFFLTSDADPGNVTPTTAATSMISGEDLRQAMSEIPANKQVVILDTCHSGAVKDSLLSSERSISGEYQRAWESIRDTTGTWLLAGAASDQLSYESSNVDHGMLTYSLLEAINNASPEGLRQAPSGELFVDVERWLNYAANRVESLKSEVGVKGVQRPEFRRSTKGSSFDIGAMDESQKGALKLRSPMPIAIIGSFEMEEEDPAGLEPAIQEALKASTKVKAWFDVSKHPNVYRVAGSYGKEGTKITLKVYIQKFDSAMNRTTLETMALEGDQLSLDTFATQIRERIEEAILKLNARKPPAEEG